MLGTAKKIYNRFLPTFEEALESEKTINRAYDNYNDILPFKANKEGKNAITHLGTAYFATKSKPIDLPNETVVRSPHDVQFVVTSCDSRDQYQYLVFGTPISQLESVAPEVVADKNIILAGVVWPEIGWEVVSMPGFTKRPPLTYAKQEIQPPRRAWVDKAATNNDILFDRKRKWKPPASKDAVSLSTNRMHSIQLTSWRIIDMSAHSQYLQGKQIRASEAVASFVPSVKLRMITCLLSSLLYAR